MLNCSLASLKIPWLQAFERLAPCSQLVAKTKKTPFYGPLTSGFAVHCVYSGLPISHENRPNVPKPTRKNNFRRVQLPSAPPNTKSPHDAGFYFCPHIYENGAYPPRAAQRRRNTCVSCRFTGDSCTPPHTAGGARYNQRKGTAARPLSHFINIPCKHREDIQGGKP